MDDEEKIDEEIEGKTFKTAPLLSAEESQRSFQILKQAVVGGRRRPARRLSFALWHIRIVPSGAPTGIWSMSYVRRGSVRAGEAR